MKETAKKKNPQEKSSGEATPRGKKKVPGEIRWKVWLAGERPWMTLLASGIILGTVAFFIWFIHLWAGVLALVVFFALLNPYYIPSYYELNPEEVVIKKFYYTDRRPWKMFRRFFLTRSGVVLSTFATRQRFLDNFRGVQLLLPTDKGAREKVLDYLELRLPLDAGQHRE